MDCKWPKRAFCSEIPLFYYFERWSKYLRLGKIDMLVQRFYGCFAPQVFEPVTWLKTINTLQIIMLGMNYHYSIYRWQAGTAPAPHVHRDMHNTWRQRQREISGRGFITTHCRQYKPKWAVLQRCAVPLISDVQFYIPLFNQVSGEKTSKDYNHHNKKTPFRTEHRASQQNSAGRVQ